MKITEKHFDIITGEETVIEREMTKDELADRKLWADLIATQQAEATAKAAQRQALLTRLGITEEEARILLGGN
jgi:hypothetical protein